MSSTASRRGSTPRAAVVAPRRPDHQPRSSGAVVVPPQVPPQVLPQVLPQDPELLANQLGAAMSQLHAEQRVTATVVHDLATPVAIVLGACEILIDDADTLEAGVCEAVQTILEHAEQMRDLVTRLRAGLDQGRALTGPS